MTAVYTLNLGGSPDGAFVHPVDEVGSCASLEAAKDLAEEQTGKPLQWYWMEERHVWRAEVGHEYAAEIHESQVLESVGVSVGLMS